MTWFGDHESRLARASIRRVSEEDEPREPIGRGRGNCRAYVEFPAITRMGTMDPLRALRRVNTNGKFEITVLFRGSLNEFRRSFQVTYLTAVTENCSGSRGNSAKICCAHAISNVTTTPAPPRTRGRFGRNLSLNSIEVHPRSSSRMMGGGRPCHSMSWEWCCWISFARMNRPVTVSGAVFARPRRGGRGTERHGPRPAGPETRCHQGCSSVFTLVSSHPASVRGR